MSEQNKELVRRMFHDADRSGQVNPDLFAPGFKAHIAGNPPMDFDGFEQFLDMFYAGFSDFNHTFEDILADGDKVAYRTRASAVHTGDFMGCAPTGKQVSVPMVGFARVANGKVAELWNNPDLLGLMQQIGLVPSPSSSG